jgi:hypothetical protein
MKKKPRTKQRKVVTRSGASPRGYFPSLKGERLIPGESQLEMAADTRFELDTRVISFAAHQTEVAIASDTGAFKYFPDRQLLDHDGAIRIVEIKAEFRLQDKEVQNRIEATRRKYAAEGVAYEVYTEKLLHSNNVHLQLMELLEFRKRGERERLLAMPEVCAVLTQPLPNTMEELAESLGGWKLVKRLLANGILNLDVTDPLNPSQPPRLH